MSDWPQRPGDAPGVRGSAARRRRLELSKAERLQLIADQVAAGELVIRQATDEERERWGMSSPSEAAKARKPR